MDLVPPACRPDSASSNPGTSTPCTPESSPEVPWWQNSLRRLSIDLGLHQPAYIPFDANIVTPPNPANASSSPAEGQHNKALISRDRKTIDMNNVGAHCLVRSLLAVHAESTLHGLVTLQATSNSISRVDAVVCRTLRSLRTLCLSANKLRALPAEIGAMQSLTSLRLESNELSSLPWQLGELHRLEQLWLGCNELSELPESMGGLRELRELWLCGNSLRGVPAAFGRLDRLERLELSENLITTLPDELAGLHRLQELWLRGNQLADVPRCLVPGPGSLTTLDLSNNRLAPAVPCLLAARPNLATVRLDGNSMLAYPQPSLVALGPEAVLSALRAALASPQADTAPSSPVRRKPPSPELLGSSELIPSPMLRPQPLRSAWSAEEPLLATLRPRPPPAAPTLPRSPHKVPLAETPPTTTQRQHAASAALPTRQWRDAPDAAEHLSVGSPAVRSVSSPALTTTPHAWVDSQRWQSWVREDPAEAERLRSRYGLKISEVVTELPPACDESATITADEISSPSASPSDTASSQGFVTAGSAAAPPPPPGDCLTCSPPGSPRREYSEQLQQPHNTPLLIAQAQTSSPQKLQGISSLGEARSALAMARGRTSSAVAMGTSAEPPPEVPTPSPATAFSATTSHSAPRSRRGHEGSAVGILVEGESLSLGHQLGNQLDTIQKDMRDVVQRAAAVVGIGTNESSSARPAPPPSPSPALTSSPSLERLIATANRF